MKCDVCGMESEFDAAFIRRPKSPTSTGKNICPECWVKRSNKRGRRFVLAIPVLALVGFLLRDEAPELSTILFNFALIGTFLVFAIVPHELGHALTARAFGWRVYQITIGIGKQLWKWRWHGALIDVRAIPIGGATFMFPRDMRLFRMKFFLAILAGPVVNAAMACAVVLAFGGTVLPFNLSPLPSAAQLFVLTNFWVLAVNLWPFTPKSGMAMATDGKRLLQLISFRKHSLDEVHAMRFMFEAYLCRDKGDLAGSRAWCDKGLALYPEDTQLLNWSGVMHLDEQNYAAAREVFLKLLAKEKQSTAQRSVLLNNIAYADALSGNPEWLPEAEAYSRDALTMLPWMASVVGTRGTVLVATGKYEEGLELLKKSMADAETARSKSENACHVVVALSRLNRREEAAKYLRLAKELDSKCPLLTRAERILEETSVAGVYGAQAAPGRGTG